MRKFKIKNRPKRKYVKKNELAASFSQTQTLTVGLIPLVLMAIAFFTTVIMYSPALAGVQLPAIRISMPALPEITLPTITLPKMTLPAIPEVSTPAIPEIPEIKVTMPEAPKIDVPKIVLPNPLPYIAQLGESVNKGLQALLLQIELLGSQIANGLIKTAEFLDPRPALAAIGNGIASISIQIAMGVRTFFVMLGEGIVSLVSAIGQGITAVITGIGNGLVQAWNWIIATAQSIGRAIQQTSVQVGIAVSAWTQSAIKATIDGVNAFVWFIGTPFRALAKAGEDFKVFMKPYAVYFAAAVKHASDDFAAGGDALMQGAQYASDTVNKDSTK